MTTDIKRIADGLTAVFYRACASISLVYALTCLFGIFSWQLNPWGASFIVPVGITAFRSLFMEN